MTPAKPIRLGYIVPQFPGQTHIFFWREILELEAMGHHVRLFSTRPPPPGLISHSWSAQAMERTEYLGRLNPVQALGALSHLPWRQLRAQPEPRAFWRDVMLTAAAARQLIASARRHSLTHIHAHSCGRAALIAALARRMGGPPYSVTLHGPLSDYGPGQRFKWSGAAFATIITDRLIAEMRGEMPLALPKAIYRQPMGVDTDWLSRPAPYVPRAADAPIRLFSCARLNVVKGHQDLLAAVRLMRDAGHDVRLDIAGEDDAGGTGFRAVLAAKIEELDLSGLVRLLGAIDADAVRDSLLAADIFVLASFHEPLGVAYMEAMSCGVPTIGTDAGGVPELIVDGRHGLLVPPKDPDALSAAIMRIATDPGLALRLSDGGRARIVDGFRAGVGAQTLVTAIAQSDRDAHSARTGITMG